MFNRTAFSAPSCAWALLAGILSTTAATWADSVTFADFIVQQAQDSYKFDSGAGTFTTISADTSSTTVPVNFTFFLPNTHPQGASTPISATLTLTALTNGTALLIENNAYQNLQNISLTFTATTPVIVGSSSLTNLLTVTGSNALLFGTNQSYEAFLNADASFDPTLSFSSDFLNLTQATEESFHFNLIAISPAFSFNSTSELLESFTGNGYGSFTAAVPEPASLTLLGLAALPLLRRRR